MFSKVSCYDLKDTFTRNQPQHWRVACGSPHPDTAQARHHGRGHQEEEQQLLPEGGLQWRVDMILARAGRQMVTICYYGRLEVFLAGCSPGPVDKPSPAATSPLSRNPLADLLSDVVMVKTGNKWISIRDKIILDIFDTQYSIDKKFRV